MAAYLGNTASITFPSAIRALGKVLFHSGNVGYPSSPDALRRVGVYLYDRHFPEGAANLGSTERKLFLQPSALSPVAPNISWGTRCSPLHAVANAYFVAAITRVAPKLPENWRIYGKSLLLRPRAGKSSSKPSRDRERNARAELEISTRFEIRDTWQFLSRHARPESSGEITRTRAGESSEAAKLNCSRRTIDDSSLYTQRHDPVSSERAHRRTQLRPLGGFP